jgi:hypothetical protein
LIVLGPPQVLYSDPTLPKGWKRKVKIEPAFCNLGLENRWKAANYNALLMGRAKRKVLNITYHNIGSKLHGSLSGSVYLPKNV